MKIVGVVCLSLCLWANAETGGFTKSDSERLDALFYGVFRNPTPQVQKVYSLGKPCVERTLAGLDNAVLDSTYTYLYRNSECYNNSLTESSRTEQQAKYKSCLETLPPKPEENMSKVVQVFKKCLNAVAPSVVGDPSAFETEQLIH